MAWKSWQTFDIYTSYIILTVRNRSCWLPLIWGRKGFVAVRMQYLPTGPCSRLVLRAPRAAAAAVSWFLTLSCAGLRLFHRGTKMLLNVFFILMHGCLIDRRQIWRGTKRQRLHVFITTEWRVLEMNRGGVCLGIYFLKDICCCTFGPREAGFSGNAAGGVYSDAVINLFPSSVFLCIYIWARVRFF